MYVLYLCIYECRFPVQMNVFDANGIVMSTENANDLLDKDASIDMSSLPYM